MRDGIALAAIEPSVLLSPTMDRLVVTSHAFRTHVKKDGHAQTSHDVLSRGNGLKVIRSHARGVAAKVVDLIPSRNRTDGRKVHNPMDIETNIANADASVSSWDTFPRPYPAFVREVNLREESVV